MTERASATVGLSRRRSWLIGAVAVALAAAVAGGGYGLWYLFLRPAAPASVAQASLAPVRLVRPDVDLDDLLVAAVAMRPDLRGVRLLVEAANVRASAS